MSDTGMAQGRIHSGIPGAVAKPLAGPLDEPLESNGDACEPYQYQALPTPTSIRLIKICPGLAHGKLKISLKTVDLIDEPFYNALSYTWGNPHAYGVDFSDFFDKVNVEYGASHAIPAICDGGTLYVQQNLHDALTQIPQDIWARQQEGSKRRGTSTPVGDADGYIWIDAICINQQDLEERAAQVRIMDRIYRIASYTVVWFGRADEYTEDLIRAVSKVAAYPREQFANTGITPYRSQDREIYEKAGLPYMSWLEWVSLAAFLKRQWFSRLWIIQECVLSQELVLFCGRLEISWSELLLAARNIQARCKVYGTNPGFVFIPHHEAAIPLEGNVLQLQDWRDCVQQRGHLTTRGFEFENLVYDTWTFRSTDPRDKIYGLLSLLTQSVRETLQVDYTVSAEECFATATRIIIHQSSRLQILSCVQDAAVRKTKAYPSWVPDYSVTHVNMLCSIFAASGRHKEAQIIPSPRWDRLRLRAALFDEIVETGNERDNYVNSMMLLEPSWFELAMLLKQPYVTGQPRTEVLWRTLCADQDSNFTTPAPVRFGQLFHQFVSAMVMVRANLEAEEVERGAAPANCSASLRDAVQYVRKFWSENNMDDLNAKELLGQFGQPPRFMSRPEQGWLIFTLFKLQLLAATEDGACTPDLESLEQFAQSPTYVMRMKTGSEWTLARPRDSGFFDTFSWRYGQRKLFYTKSGYLGLGPAATKVGDVVYIVPGAGGPFVFRPNDRPDTAVPDGCEGEAAGYYNAIRLQLIGESYVHGIMHGEATERDYFQLTDVEII